MNFALFRYFAALAAAVACLTACGGLNNSTPSVSSAPATVRLRFIEAAPLLEAPVNGVPTGLGLTQYLSVNGTTISSPFPYTYISSYSDFRAGSQSVEVLDELGYKVGPIKTDSLSSGKQYTIAIVGSYPNYTTIAFEDPSATTSAQLTLYEAAPSFANVDFGRFEASTHSNFQKLGSAAYRSVVSASLANSVSNFGGYAGRGAKPFRNGALTLAAVNSFDARNVLPFNAATRLSLFVMDPAAAGDPPTVLGSLDP